MATRLSDRVRAENAAQALNEIIHELCTNMVRDDAETDEQQQESVSKTMNGLLTTLNKKTCGQLKDLIEIADAVSTVIGEAARYRSLTLILTPDADDHHMCEAERQMYEAMDELDANLKTTEG